MTPMSPKRLLSAAIATAAICWAQPVLSQTQQQQPQQQQPAQFTQEDLQSFAAAAVEIRQLSQKWQPRIEGAGSAVESEELSQQAQAAMAEAVKAEGLTLQDYNEIYRLAQADPQVRQQVLAYMQQAE